MFPNSSEKYARQIGIMFPSFAGKKDKKLNFQKVAFALTQKLTLWSLALDALEHNRMSWRPHP